MIYVQTELSFTNHLTIFFSTFKTLFYFKTIKFKNLKFKKCMIIIVKMYSLQKEIGDLKSIADFVAGFKLFFMMNDFESASFFLLKCNIIDGT